MREQPNNVKSVNVLVELCNLLAILHSNVDADTVRLLTQLVLTIKETCQGNTLNQAVVYDCKVPSFLGDVQNLQKKEVQTVDFVNQLLVSDECRACAEDDRLDLQMQLAYLLRTLTEENQGGQQSAFQSKTIMTSVNKETLWTVRLIQPRS